METAPERKRGDSVREGKGKQRWRGKGETVFDTHNDYGESLGRYE